MNIVSAVLFGIIQGLTEFLPVSSSGHLAIFQNIFGMENMEQSHMTFSVLLHLGTLLAVFIVYWRDFFPLVPAFFRGCGKLFHGKHHLEDYDENERMVFYIILSTLPLLPAALINDYLALLSDYTKIVGVILIFNAVVLYLSDRFAGGQKQIGDVKPRNAIIVGLCQVCAILPGLSRSGSTITGGLTQGFSREFAVKFSFLLSIPAILGANVMEIPDLLQNPVPASDIPAYVLGVVTAMVVGVCAMKLLQLIARKSNFRIFSYYCLAVGLAAVIFG